MAQYEYASVTSSGVPIYPDARKAVIRPEPESPKALAELAAAADAYSKAASMFISSRDALNDAKDEWVRCQTLVSSLTDKEGV